MGRIPSSSSSSNEWPQQRTLKMMMTTMPPNNSTATGSRTAGEMGMPQQQQPPGPVNCPRCDSTNTKFCYYNNYSLAQPRHFCKACKRYWTRGGTLRNVPVGGGYRKNKRAKKPSPSAAANPPPAISINPPPLSAELNPFFYADISNLPLPLPLGLSFNDHHSLFDSSLFSATAAAYEDIRTMGSGDLGVQKEAKVEAEANADGCDAIDWRLHCQNPYEALAAAESGESHYFYWNGTVGSAWPYANNCGSSVASLI